MSIHKDLYKNYLSKKKEKEKEVFSTGVWISSIILLLIILVIWIMKS